jgi:Effector-associated domain 2
MRVRPEASSAVLVGIDHYAAGWRLEGPAHDARLLATRLLELGVPPERVTLLLSPGSGEFLGIPIRPADYATVRSVLVEELAARPSEFLLLSWGGHGVVRGTDQRRLFCADATAVDKRNVDLNSLLAALRSTLYRHPRQAVLVDACQNHVEELNLEHELPSESFPRGAPSASVTQKVLLAAGPGQVAVNDGPRGTGLFSSVVREEWGAEWPPNLDLLRERVGRRFVELRAAGRTTQVPTHLWTRGADGETVLFTADRTRAGGLPTATVGALADLLLDLDELAGGPSRWQVILQLLPREMASALSGVGPQRLQVIDLIRTCERFPGGQKALLDAVHAAVADGSARARVTEAFGKAWPGLVG